MAIVDANQIRFVVWHIALFFSLYDEIGRGELREVGNLVLEAGNSSKKK